MSLIDDLKAKLASKGDTFTMAQLEAAVLELIAPAEAAVENEVVKVRGDMEVFVDSLTKGAVDPTKTVLDTASEHEEPEVTPANSYTNEDEFE